ncbi:MAG TPA: hypothetical protein VFV38_27395 [Ktedonobacteraceae bacterium]|nr:hypothetical protein [Ktedonobacteraceae bacterium]
MNEREKATTRRRHLLYRARMLLKECEVVLDAREQRVLKLGIKNWLEGFQREVEKSSY